MKRYLAIAIFSASIFITACAPGVKPINAEQRVYLAQADFNAVLRFADEYQSLPTCVGAVKPNCSVKATADKLQAAKENGAAAIKNAQTLVRSAEYQAGSEAALLATAKAAAVTLQTILDQLRALGYVFK